jgi:hypothetical protein
MNYEEMAIMNFLRTCGETFMSRREIARKALKRQVFEENPHWADGPLGGLVDQGLIEQNDSGHYRLKRYEG